MQLEQSLETDLFLSQVRSSLDIMEQIATYLSQR